MKMRDDSEIYERIRYFIEILVPKYEKHFGTSLSGIYFWDPLGIENYPEEVEAAILSLQKAIADNKPLFDEEDDVDESLIIPSDQIIY